VGGCSLSLFFFNKREVKKREDFGLANMRKQVDYIRPDPLGFSLRAPMCRIFHSSLPFDERTSKSKTTTRATKKPKIHGNGNNI
jgi:hypothetical protein